MHPHIKLFWMDLLKIVHPNAEEYFKDIDPDVWHKNYKDRVDFAADSRSIFRHVLDIANAPRYVPWATIKKEERIKYIENAEVPGGTKQAYDKLFNQAVGHIVMTWKALFPFIESGEVPPSTLIKDWNLDTGVDESKIDLWNEV